MSFTISYEKINSTIPFPLSLFLYKIFLVMRNIIINNFASQMVKKYVVRLYHVTYYILFSEEKSIVNRTTKVKDDEAC